MRRIERLGRHRRGEEGVSAVLTAMVMMIFLSCVAISVDITAAFADKQTLQNAADAAALAVAQTCATGDCGNYQALALDLVRKNSTKDSNAEVTLDTVQGTVAVKATNTKTHYFAPVIGVSSSNVGARASTAWGWPSGGVTLPLIFSYCTWGKQTNGGTPNQVFRVNSSKETIPGCNGPSGNYVPGGFGWLYSTNCSVNIDIGNTVWSDPGKSEPGVCGSDIFLRLKTEPILLPLFDTYGGSGNNAYYHIYGFAMVRLTGYNFVQHTWNCNPCSSSTQYIDAYFIKYVSLADAMRISPSAPHLGVVQVKMSS